MNNQPLQFTLADINKLFQQKGDTLNKGFDPYSVLTSPIMEALDDEQLAPEDVTEAHELEARLFTFFTSPFDKPFLDTQEKMVGFLRSMVVMDLAVTVHYNGDTALKDILEVLEALDVYTVTHVRKLDTGFTRFEISDRDYRLVVKVNDKNGYRQGFINDKPLFTKSGSLTLTDMAGLVKVLNLLV